MKEEIENVFCENLFEWPWLDSGLSEHHTHIRTPNTQTHIYTMHTRVLQKATEVEINLESYIFGTRNSSSITKNLGWNLKLLKKF
jgi:hypothetical protein